MVIVLLGSLIDALFLETAGGRDVDFTANDRFDSFVQRLAIKFDGAEHVAVVGHGHRRLLERFNALEKLIDLVGPVEQAIFSVAM